MTRRLVVLCGFLLLLSIVASCEEIPPDNSGDESPQRRIEDNTGRRKDTGNIHHDPEDAIEENIVSGGELLPRSDDPEVKMKKKIEDTEAHDNLDGKRRQSEDSRSPWFTSIPLLPVVYAESATLPEGPCKKQAQRYLRDLKNGTLWATQMYDASTKYPDGLISGRMMHLGDFDGCYDLEAKLIYRDDDDLGIDEAISGRYCLVDIEYDKRGLPPVNPDARHELVFDPNDSAWEAMRERGDTRRLKRYALRLALCVPAVCSYADIGAALQAPLKNFGAEQNLNINISVKPHFCQARKDAPEFSRAAKIYCSIIAGLIALVLISTCYDFATQDDEENVDSTAREFILCFSARRNFNTLVEPTYGYRGIQSIHLVRTVWSALAMIGHRIIQYWIGPTINVSYIESLYPHRMSMILFAGTHIIEGFYGLSGLLVSYSLLGELEARKKMNFLSIIFIRFFRLTPLYMLVVFFCALILPHVGSGPYWEWKIGSERDACANNWWTNLLYINNYAKPNEMCMFQSWYLSTDFHLFALALIVTYLFWRMPRKYGYPFLCAIIIGGCVLPFVNTYAYGVQPMYIGFLNLEDPREDPYFVNHYIKTHERITSYFVGVLAGAIIHDHSRAPWFLGKVSSNILFIVLAAGFSLGSEFLGHPYLDPDAKPSRLGAALYACLHKGAFAISTCALPLLVTIGTGLTFQYNFMTPLWCQPLARLTYGAYLVHTIIQLYDVGVTRAPRSFSIHDATWNWTLDVLCSFAVSFVLAIIVEGPFRRLEKSLITKRKKIHQSTGAQNGAIKKMN